MEYLLIRFIQNYYQIHSSGSKIIIIDVFENKITQPMIIEITESVSFVWGKAFDITSINPYEKNYSFLPNIIRQIFRDKRTLDFYKFLIKENQIVTIRLSEIKEEFPKLYDERLQTIISESISKDKL